MCKNDKNAFKFAFPESPEILETHAQKTFNLQHNCEIKMPQIMVFWSDREVKNTAKCSMKLKCHENFTPQYFLALK